MNILKKIVDTTKKNKFLILFSCIFSLILGMYSNRNFLDQQYFAVAQVQLSKAWSPVRFNNLVESNDFESIKTITVKMKSGSYFSKETLDICDFPNNLSGSLPDNIKITLLNPSPSIVEIRIFGKKKANLVECVGLIINDINANQIEEKKFLLDLIGEKIKEIEGINVALLNGKDTSNHIYELMDEWSNLKNQQMYLEKSAIKLASKIIVQNRYSQKIYWIGVLSYLFYGFILAFLVIYFKIALSIFLKRRL